jgi:hypothetical protein
VAGIAALLRTQSPVATVAQLEAALAQSARSLPGTRFGHVDAFAALQRLGRPGPTLEPTIEGDALPGRTLTAYSGVWAGAGLQIAYRWERCRDGCEPVGAERTYAVRPEDAGSRLRIVLSASGAADAVSPATALVPTRPRSLSAPAISGRPVVGATLRSRLGTWSGGGTLAFLDRWERCRDASCRTSSVVGRSRTYRLREPDRRRWLRFSVIAVNDAGRTIASSAPTRRIR